MQPDKRPILLIVAGNWWPPAARLAAAFIEHGCVVAAVCPPGHPLRYVQGMHQIRTLRGLSSRRSLEQAVRRVRPDLVIPCDDRSVAQLHELHRLRPHLRALIECSIGEPHGFEVVESRSKLLDTARELGIRVASASGVTSEAQAAECYALGAPLALLKMDGTSGGEGVQFVHSAPEAAAAFRRMRSGAGTTVAIKRLLVNRDPQALWSWSRRQKPTVTLQQFVPGTPANIMVACWRGEVLAELSVQVVSCQGPTGSALVVQVIANPQFSRAAALLTGRLKLSGFFGLDFILEQGTGTEYLIEMNPRCTQLGHLKLPKGDLAGALCAALLGRERPPTKTPIVSDTIAFFPQALLWGAQTGVLERVHYDVPWEQRQLVKELIQDPWPQRQWLARLYHLFRRPAMQQAVATAPTEQLAEAQRRSTHPAPARSPTAFRRNA
jgi:predicted ATP-grasp superfamily ATP-dependent carboligase